MPEVATETKTLPEALYEVEIASRSPSVSKFLMEEVADLISRRTLDEDCIKLWRMDEEEGKLEPEGMNDAAPISPAGNDENSAKPDAPQANNEQD